MRGNSSLWVIGLLLPLSGCIAETKHPVFDDRTAVTEPLLEGVWEVRDRPYLITADGKGGYRILALTEEPGVNPGDEVRLFRREAVFAWPVGAEVKPLRLLRFDEFYFLDSADKGPVCTARISFVGSDVRIAPLQVNWLREYLRKHPRALQHEIRREKDSEVIVLKAETKDLQKFLLAHLGELFGDGERMKRIGKTRHPLYPAKGPAAKGQRAFDAWWDARAAVRDVPLYPRNSGAEARDNARFMARHLREFSEQPMETEIGESVRAVADFYEEASRFLPSAARKPETAVVVLRELLKDPERRLGPDEEKLKPIQGKWQEVLAVTKKAAKTLSKRYDRTFPPMEVVVPD